MKIVRIIGDESGNGLYSIHYPNEKENVYDTLLERWNDVQFLRETFEQHYNGLVYFRINSIEEAIHITLREAEELDDWLYDLAENPKQNLQSAFSPLNNEVYVLTALQPSKAKAKWLRIYAIRIDKNCYLITGGAIKLTHKMKEDKLLQSESDNISRIREYLKEEGILYPEDLNTDES